MSVAQFDGPAINSAFSVSPDLIKQEPEDPLLDEVIDGDAKEESGDLTVPEDSDILMQRAVSPPCYFDTSEDRIKELFLYYKDKYRLKAVEVELERCDKIWETLQLINRLQSSICNDTTSIETDELENSSTVSSETCDLPVVQKSSLKNRCKEVPDFRFSIKSRKTLFYCITCGKEYGDDQELKQHAKEEHGIFVAPKRIYNTRTDSINDKPVITRKNEVFVEKTKIENVEAKLPKLEHLEAETLNQYQETINKAQDSTIKSKETLIKSKRNSTKEKIKCVLCKRITIDIVSHMKHYHKVGCMTPIIAQCEKITEDNEVTDNSEGDINEIVNIPRKRKRVSTNWTVQKKSKPMISIPVNNITLANSEIAPKNGLFNSLSDQFLNSSFINSEKTNNTIEEKPINSVPKPAVPHQALVNDSFVENQAENFDVQRQESNFQTKCECGRLFRNYHTFYLHKVKCKGIEFQDNDQHDQNINKVGLSIKIKKNKNDSYEVVPKNNLADEKYKELRNSKDSDVSSNDSGMVSSVDYNNLKVDNSELPMYVQSHSILRIQAAENDEEIDIEDGEDTDKTSLNKNDDLTDCISRPDSTSRTSFSTLENDTKENCTVHLLNNLDRQSMSHQKQDVKLKIKYKCQVCFGSFNNESELKEHILQMNHNIRSHCPCGKKFKDFKYFNIHVKRVHRLLLNCGYCATNFNRVEDYIQHDCKIVEGKLFIEPIIQTPCHICKSLIDLGEPFDKHMKTHQIDSTVHQCFKCDKVFDNIQQRKLHFNKDHGFSICRVCGKCLQINHLSKHEAYHEGLGHPCHTCKKAFTQKSLLKKHVQYSHDPLVNESLNCHICSKIIKLKNLKKHMSFHMHKEICNKCDRCSANNDKKLENAI